MSSSSYSCTGRGIELKTTLSAQTAFFGKLLHATPARARQDETFEQTFVFEVRRSFLGSFQQGEIVAIEYQTRSNLESLDSASRHHVEIGKGYAVVTSKLVPRKYLYQVSPRQNTSRRVAVYFSPLHPCHGVGLRLVKESHPIGRAIWVIYTGIRQTREIRADVLTEYLRTDGRF